MSKVASLPSVELDRDGFMRTLIRELSGTLQDVVGLEEAAGFVSVVGLEVGRQLDSLYKEALETREMTPEQVAEVLVDLKRRIEGDFFIIEQDEERIVLATGPVRLATKYSVVRRFA